MKRALISAAGPTWRRVGEVLPRPVHRLFRAAPSARTPAGALSLHQDAAGGAGVVESAVNSNAGETARDWERMETPRGGSSQRRQALYDSHVPTSLLEKALLAGRAAFGALRDPARADLVADLGDATGAPALEWMRRRMRESETGRLVLAERPRVAALAELDRMEVSAPAQLLSPTTITQLRLSRLLPS